MLVSTKGRYALRVLVDLAEHRARELVPLKEIADRQGISEKYLENILAGIVRHGLLIGRRGRGGGYRLAWPPERYTVKRVLDLTEGSLAPVSCLEDDLWGCERAAGCRTLAMWRGLDEVITAYLESVTVADLVERPCSQDT